MKLFVAALVPGILTAIIYVIGIIIWVKLRPEIAPNPKSEPKPSWGERFNALGSAWELAILFAAVMGTIYLGVATATEAAALGALFALIAVIRRPGRKRAVLEGLRDTGTATCSIFALVIGAGLFSLGLSTTGFPTHLASLVAGLNLSQTGTIVLVLLPFLILGCFVDGLSMILIMMPIVFPIVQRVGFDGVLFGLLVVKMVEIGAITPPVGLNVFVVKSMAPNVELRDMFYGCIPFVILELMIVALLIAFPQIALFAVSD